MSDVIALTREHLQSLDPYADVVLLLPKETDLNNEIHIYILTPENVDLRLEQQYLHAKNKVESLSGKSISVFIYSKEVWHQQFNEMPIYQRVELEGIRL